MLLYGTLVQCQLSTSVGWSSKGLVHKMCQLRMCVLDAILRLLFMFFITATIYNAYDAYQKEAYHSACSWPYIKNVSIFCSVCYSHLGRHLMITIHAFIYNLVLRDIMHTMHIKL